VADAHSPGRREEVGAFAVDKGLTGTTGQPVTDLQFQVNS
jgi:hypothetical protein